MKNRKVHILFTLALIVGVAAGVSLTARSSRGQVQAPQTTSTVKPTARITETGNTPKPENTATAATSATTTTAPNTSPAFLEAAGLNASLRNELPWTFGGKQQRGWYLYDLLIGKTLNTADNSDPNDFAAALAGWQKKRGLSADGVLNEDSLMAMVSQWQSNRLKDRTYADPSQLIMAPPSDFYDPARLPELRQVERNTYAAYKQMIAAAIADPALKLESTGAGELAPTEKYFKIVSAFRSREYQEELRRKSPNAGSAGLAVNNSPHFTGRALDLYVGGDPVDTRDANRAIQVNTPAYKWLVRNAERFGFRPYFYEPWHWEYVR